MSLRSAFAFAMLCGSILAACGGSGAGSPAAAGSTRNDLAATACEDYAKGQLGEKTYKLDHAVLGSSMKDAGDGASALSAPISIDPGLSSESRQTLECSVRFVPGKDAPDVLAMQFIWQ
jgi:hypothetical protein